MPLPCDILLSAAWHRCRKWTIRAVAHRRGRRQIDHGRDAAAIHGGRRSAEDLRGEARSYLDLGIAVCYIETALHRGDGHEHEKRGVSSQYCWSLDLVIYHVGTGRRR